MDHHSGLRLLIALLLVALFPLSAVAYGGMDKRTLTYYVYEGNPGIAKFDSPTAVANWNFSSLRASANDHGYLTGSWSCTPYSNGSGGVCRSNWRTPIPNPPPGTPTSRDMGWFESGYLIRTEFTCPSNSTDKGGNKCQCNPNYLENAGQCKQYTCGVTGSYSQVVQPDMKVENVGPQCMNGCEVNPGSVKLGENGQLWAVWPFKATGKFCEGNKDPVSDYTTGETVGEPAPVPCGAGMCPGSINGTDVCMPCKSTSVPGSSSAASAADGSTTQTTKETKCNLSECTTTTTTTTRDPSGNITGSSQSQETQDQQSFCKQNPSASVCKQGSFGGACAGGFTCEGDAVQCALAREVHKRNCEWFEKPEALVTAGDAAIAGGDRPEGHPGKDADASVVNFGSQLDFSERLGGACPVDVGVVVAGHHVIIPWSKYCGTLQMIGNIAVAICTLAAAFIVFRG